MSLPIYYTTVENVKRRAPPVGSLSTVNSAQIADFIGEAEAKINAKLSAVYTIPMSPTPPLIQTLATDLSCLRILTSQPQFFAGDKTFVQYASSFTEANSVLQEILDGKITLVNSAGAQVDGVSTAGVWHNNVNYTPTFDVGPPEEQEVDPDRVDDIESARV